MTDNNFILTKEYLHEHFEYRDGVLYKKPQTKRCKSNIKVGTLHSEGYIRIGIKFKLYYSHRLIFMMFYGYMPEQIDHIDGNRTNNRIENLRSAINASNMLNIQKNKTNKSGYKNVCWDKGMKKWAVQLKAFNKKYIIGYFEDLELAGLVAMMAREKYHGLFANHG